MLGGLLLYFFLALLIDAGLTCYYRFIHQDKPFRAGVASSVVTWFNLTVLVALVHMDKQPFIIAFSFGAGLGTILGMRLRSIARFITSLFPRS